jgi:hypothetical protein
MSKTSCLKLAAAVLAAAALAASAVCAAEAEGKATLPDPVAKAFKDAFPKGEVRAAEAENEGGVEVFDIEFREGKTERECEIAADGTILEAATVVAAEAVPEPVMKALRKAAQGGSIRQIEKIEVRAGLEAGKIAKLDKVRIRFEAELEKGERSGEVTVAEDGAVVEPAKRWSAEEEEEEEGEGR